MAKRAPGFIADGSAVDDAVARTEILAGAFKQAAGGYFERQVDYEEAIEEAEENRDSAKIQGIAGVVAGVVLALGGIWMENIPVALVGVAVAVAVGWWKYTEYQSAIDRIEENQQSLRQNEPDGQVTFVSQIGVPAYLVQYGTQHMIFDGLAIAPETRLDLALVDGDALIEARNDLEEVSEAMDRALSDEQVLDPDLAQDLSPGITDHRRLEKPITDGIDRMTAIARDVTTESISVNVHANNTPAQSLRTLGQDGLFQADDALPLVETRQSLAESKSLIGEIKGVEEQAVSGDLLGQVRDHREAVVDITADIGERLDRNAETVSDHFEAHAGTVDDSTRKYVCEECLADRVAAIDDELDLVDEILSPETGSFGVALSDPDLDYISTEGAGQFTDQIRDEIAAHIPNVEDRLRDAYNTLPDLGVDGEHCATHGSVETTAVPQDGYLFGEVWRSLYYQFRDPIMDSVEELERESEDVRQNKEQKMIDLAQYEQIKDSIKRDYQTVKADHEAARTVERELK